MTDALLIIDVQRGFFEPEPRPWEADLVVDRINGLSSRAREAGVPVVLIQHEAQADGVVPGSPAWELYPRLATGEGDLRVGKTSPDSFLGTDLAPLLGAAGVRRVVLCGFATEFCVDTTARRAAGLGFGVCVAADAHTTHDQPHARAEWIRAHHNATLPQITSFGAPIEALAAADVRFR